MSSWLALLLVTAACLRFGVAEGDPLPAALVELVRNTPISSIEDLQLLLLSDSVDEEQDTSAATGGHRLPRSLDAQPAQQALCKVRTEVVEVTRSMLDRSNANFLLWPPCVEVQRCSGCCNAKSLQCVPVVTHTRYLQVMKIEYVNKRPTYAKAVVSVVDHVECRCQPTPKPPPPKKKTTRRQHSSSSSSSNSSRELHHNQTLTTALGQVKLHSKDELHQWDELKQNQRSHMEHDHMDQQWSPRGDTFTQAADSSSLHRGHPSRGEESFHLTPLWSHNSTSNKTAHSAGNVTTEVKGIVRDIPSFGLEESAQTHSPIWHQDKYTQIQTSAPSAPVTPDPVAHTEASIARDDRRVRPTKEPNPDPQVRHRDNETPQKDRLLEREEAKLEEEKRELLLLHKRLDQEKEILRQQQLKREEEERQREADSHLHKHHHHHVHTAAPTTVTTTTTTTTTQAPSAPAGPRPPAQPRQRRRRKNRKRISKAAMRAMLM